MEYIMMLIGEEPDFAAIDPAEMQAMLDEMSAFNQQLIDAGVLVRGNGLRERATATTVTFDADGNTSVAEGPASDAAEQLMGYWVIRCESADEALAWTRKVPMRDAKIEIRPLVEDEGEVGGQEVAGRDEPMTGEELLERVSSRE